ncbi:MAG: hypothetical protein V9G12_10080 [Microthrixaceae bacterium]
MDWEGQWYTGSYTYDAYDRPLSTTYPDNDVVAITGYDSGGRPAGLTSTLGGTVTTLVGCVSYDAAGRLEGALRRQRRLRHGRRRRAVGDAPLLSVGE